MATNLNAKTTGVGGLETSADNSGNINIQSGGTTVMAVTSSGVDVTGDLSIGGSSLVANPSFRNLIINGDMRIAQRGTSVTGITGSGYRTCDRWQTTLSTGGTWTQSQSTDVPSGQGFVSSLKYNCTTANSSLSAGSIMAIQTKLEGQNLQHLKKGTSSAEKLTLSFWVKSNKTGTYTSEFEEQDNSRSISKTFTIDTADTWEKKTLTFDGDTSGALDNDNASSLVVNIFVLAGTNFTSGTLATSWSSLTNANRISSSNVNLADSTSNYINITGIQLEVGTEATEFEHRPYDMELARCQRYYYLHCEGSSRAVANGAMYTAAVAYANIKFPVNMRADPSIEVASATNFRAFAGNGTSNATSVSIWSQGGTTNEFISLSGLARTQGQACFIDTNNAACKLAFVSEL